MTIMVIVKLLISNRKEVNAMGRLQSMNYWNKQVDKKFPRSAQGVLCPNVTIANAQISADSCGQGSCNCGGGCNGECSTSCES